MRIGVLSGMRPFDHVDRSGQLFGPIPDLRGDVLSKKEGVSVATVVSAYRLLEDRGLVESRPQSGHYVRGDGSRPAFDAPPEPRPVRLVGVGEGSRVQIADRVRTLFRSLRDPTLVPLGAAIPHPSVLPVDALSRALARNARDTSSAAVGYGAVVGNTALRRQLARRALEAGCGLHPDELVVTVGAMEALHLALRATTRAGDTIAVETPTYYGLLQLVESLQLRVVEIPAQPRLGMDLDALDAALRVGHIRAVLAVPSFSNPLGALMPDDAKERLVATLARHEIPLIEDDVYGELGWTEARPRAAKAFDRRGLVLLCGSVSKTIAPGLRVGWIAPGRFFDEVERLKFAQTVTSPTVAQMAVAELLDGGGYDRHLRRMRKRLAEQVAAVSDVVSSTFPSGTRVSRPAGGFVLWVEMPARVSAAELQVRALARGISIAPGPVFSARERFASCVRLSCGAPFSTEIAAAVRTVGRLACELAEEGSERPTVS
jgi:DNA-binding transcriptional MocR family regulator